MCNKLACLLVICLFSLPVFAGPTLIMYEASNLGSDRWQYEYTVTNNSFTEGISEFTIWFDYDFYDNLVIETMDTSSGIWDEIVSQPLYISPFDPFDGMYDALALDESIAVGQTVSGFTVSFDWLGTGNPMSQDYEIINPETFETIGQGSTLTDAIVIPAPGAFILCVIGVSIINLRKNKSSL